MPHSPAPRHGRWSALAEQYLVEGRLAEGETALVAALKENPKDAQSRFGFGTVQFLRAVERMVQSFHRFGLRPDSAGGNIPLRACRSPRTRPRSQSDMPTCAGLRGVGR